MSIKGDWAKLYIGKDEANIIDIFGNKSKIKYEDIEKIEYEFRSTTEGGIHRFLFSIRKNQALYILKKK